jgi:hypothetical protein
LDELPRLSGVSDVVSFKIYRQNLQGIIEQFNSGISHKHSRSAAAEMVSERADKL